MNRKTVVLALALSPALAVAQVPPDDGWRFQVILYGYFPDVGGRTSFPHRGIGSDVTVDDGTILKDLQGVFMGMAEVSKGRFGLYTDVMYLDVDGSKSGTRDLAIGGVPLPGDVTASANLNVKGWVWTIAGTYQLVQDSRATVQALAGARLLDVDQTLSYSLGGNVGPLPLPGRQGDLAASQSNWDAIVGAKGRVTFGNDREWFVPGYVDVGTGQSKLTWQAIAGLGYSFRWGEVIAAWRYLDYDMKSGSKIESLDFNGPAIGVSFRW